MLPLPASETQAHVRVSQQDCDLLKDADAALFTTLSPVPERRLKCWLGGWTAEWTDRDGAGLGGCVTASRLPKVERGFNWSVEGRLGGSVG